MRHSLLPPMRRPRNRHVSLSDDWDHRSKGSSQRTMTEQRCARGMASGKLQELGSSGSETSGRQKKHCENVPAMSDGGDGGDGDGGDGEAGRFG